MENQDWAVAGRGPLGRRGPRAGLLLTKPDLTVENVEKFLTEHVGDLTSFRERLMALKALLTEKLETIKQLDETILEFTKPRELEKEIEDSGEFCEQKFTYLKNCVTSNAESAIAGLPLTADHYKVAIGKPHLLISNYMRALLKTSICQFSA